MIVVDGFAAIDAHARPEVSAADGGGTPSPEPIRRRRIVAGEAAWLLGLTGGT